MKPVKKAQPDRLMHHMHQQASNDPEEVVVPSVAALIMIEAVLSLTIIGILVARAVNILG